MPSLISLYIKHLPGSCPFVLRWKNHLTVRWISNNATIGSLLQEVYSLVVPRLIFKCFTTRHDFLCLFIKGYFQTCMNGSVCHDRSDRMIVSCFNGCIGLFATAD